MILEGTTVGMIFLTNTEGVVSSAQMERLYIDISYRNRNQGRTGASLGIYRLLAWVQNTVEILLVAPFSP